MIIVLLIDSRLALCHVSFISNKQKGKYYSSSLSFGKTKNQKISQNVEPFIQKKKKTNRGSRLSSADYFLKP